MSSESVKLSDNGALPRLIRRHGCWLALVVAVAAGAGGWAVWRPRTPPPEPPLPDLAEVDSEVAAAITVARNKVRQRPNDGAAWGLLGMVFQAHDFRDEANHCFREAERLDPAEPRWPYLHGRNLVLTDPDAGIPCLRRAVERCGNKPLAPRLYLVEILLSQGRLDECELYLEQASKAEPQNRRVQLDLGRLALLRAQWQTALAHLDSCVEDKHARRLAHTLRAEAWTHLREPDKARAEQRQAAEGPEDQLWPDPFVKDVTSLQGSLAVRLRQAHDLVAQQLYPQAVQLLEETVRLYPRSLKARLLLGYTWQQLGQAERAEQTLAEALQIDPESADAWFRLGCLQGLLDRPREAVASFRRTIRLKPDHADAHLNLGHFLKELGDVAGAADEFRAALRCRPDHELAQKALRAGEEKRTRTGEAPTPQGGIPESKNFYPRLQGKRRHGKLVTNCQVLGTNCQDSCWTRGYSVL